MWIVDRRGESGKLEGPSCIFLENRSHFKQKIGLEEGFVGAVVGPGAEKACLVAVLKAVGVLPIARGRKGFPMPNKSRKPAASHRSNLRARMFTLLAQITHDQHQRIVAALEVALQDAVGQLLRRIAAAQKFGESGVHAIGG